MMPRCSSEADCCISWQSSSLTRSNSTDRKLSGRGRCKTISRSKSDTSYKQRRPLQRGGQANSRPLPKGVSEAYADPELWTALNGVVQKASRRPGGWEEALKRATFDSYGRIARQEVQKLFVAHGSGPDLADSLFKYIDPYGRGMVDFDDFQRCFLPITERVGGQCSPGAATPRRPGTPRSARESGRAATKSPKRAESHAERAPSTSSVADADSPPIGRATSGLVSNPWGFPSCDMKLDDGRIRSSIEWRESGPDLEPRGYVGKALGTPRQRRPTPPRSLSPSVLWDLQVRGIVKVIGEREVQRQNKLHRAFRHLDHGGEHFELSRETVRKFFLSHNFSDDVADRFFDSFPRATNGGINFFAFQRAFLKHIQPCPCVPKLKSFLPADPRRQAVMAKFKDLEVVDVLEDIGRKITGKALSPFQVFRKSKPLADGTLSRAQVQQFFHHWGGSEAVADKFVDCLDPDKLDRVSFDEMQSWFQPFIEVNGARAYCGLAAGNLKDVDLIGAMEAIGTIESPRESKTWKAFRNVGGDCHARVSREEVRAYFNSHFYSKAIADTFYDELTNGGEEDGIDYNEFQRRVGGFIREREAKFDDPELDKVLRDIGERSRRRFVDRQGASMASIWTDCSGLWVDRKQVRAFFNRYAYGSNIADRYFDYSLGSSPEERIPSSALRSLLLPEEKSLQCMLPGR
mmetsp:Transcript_23952/g.66583  ORF Transcript_23952/g.66583 Transcript_23952/m.66583 type:complete len:689 (-) Transcript_23952:79-2145(-)